MRYSQSFLAPAPVMVLALAVPLLAQPPGPRRAGPPPTPQAAAPIDLTGYWVSIVTEDWRYRMVTPAPGDYQGVPMTPAAIKLADAWDPAKDEAAGEQCKSYGAPSILRVPEHLHITWQDEKTLHMEIDAGKQTRVFHFGDGKPGANASGGQDGSPSLQGDSVAQWEMQREGGRPVGGSLKVTTTHLKAGYLRKNGVPFSENANLVEYYDMVHERNGDQLMVVTIVVTDPMYLREPFIISSHFKKLPDATGWKPSDCSSKW
jgi:hypothetical protein